MASAKTKYASTEEHSAPVAFVAIDSAFHWRNVLGIVPALEAAQPGHTRYAVAFWIIVALCAAAYVIGLRR